MISPITLAPCLWFDRQAEEAIAFYCSIFPNSRVLSVSRYGEAGFEHHHMPAGTVLGIDFELDHHRMSAINGGPVFKFNEAISLQVLCETQADVDHYWARLSEHGDEQAQMCGWLKDKYGVSWQVVPTALRQMLADPDPRKSERVMSALLKMKKLDIAGLTRAFNGDR